MRGHTYSRNWLACLARCDARHTHVRALALWHKVQQFLPVTPQHGSMKAVLLLCLSGGALVPTHVHRHSHLHMSRTLWTTATRLASHDLAGKSSVSQLREWSICCCQLPTAAVPVCICLRNVRPQYCLYARRALQACHSTQVHPLQLAKPVVAVAGDWLAQLWMADTVASD